MSLSVDDVINVIKLRKKLFFWRLFTFILVVVAIFFFSSSDDRFSNIVNGDYIASITINGGIDDDRYRGKKLQEIANNEKIKAVILSIDSPGGDAFASEVLFNKVRNISLKKPIVAVLRGVAASGGYMVALATDHIYAHESTITGSIGVIMKNVEVTELINKLGVNFEIFKTNPLKGGPNMYEKTSPEMKKEIYNTINDLHELFVEKVMARRNMSLDKVKDIANGRVFVGRTALNLGLIDAIGDEEAAKQWLVKEKPTLKDLKLLEINIIEKKKNSINPLNIVAEGKKLMKKSLFNKNTFSYL